MIWERIEAAIAADIDGTPGLCEAEAYKLSFYHSHSQLLENIAPREMGQYHDS